VIGKRALDWVRPSGTDGWHDPFMPSELAALQTFPPTYRWPSKKAEACLQIGNAVPPRVAQLLLLEGECARAQATAPPPPRCVSPSLAWNGPLGRRPPVQGRDLTRPGQARHSSSVSWRLPQ